LGFRGNDSLYLHRCVHAAPRHCTLNLCGGHHHLSLLSSDPPLLSPLSSLGCKHCVPKPSIQKPLPPNTPYSRLLAPLSSLLPLSSLSPLSPLSPPCLSSRGLSTVSSLLARLARLELSDGRIPHSPVTCLCVQVAPSGSCQRHMRDAAFLMVRARRAFARRSPLSLSPLSPLSPLSALSHTHMHVHTHNAVSAALSG
jgi:hypothetical protein